MIKTSSDSQNPEETIDTLRAQVARQSLLSEIILLIARTRDIESQPTEIMIKLNSTIDFQRCTLATVNSDTKTYQLRTLLETRQGISDNIPEVLPLSNGISGSVIRSDSMKHFPNFVPLDKMPTAADNAMEGGSIRSILSLPLNQQDKVLGAITFGRSEALAFNDQDIEVIENVVEHLALAVGRWRQSQDLAESAERHTLAMYASNEGLWDWNLRSNELFISPKMKELLGLPPGNMPVTVAEWQAR
ncbi:GAF domain-containing protein, partial [Pseudomonadota bacterium]